MAIRADLRCYACGYVMDAAECLSDPGETPNDGDISFCFNCGTLYVFEGTRFRRMSRKERRGLDKEMLQQINRAELVRRVVITEDLAFNQKLKQ
jgi:GH24 family phage-related lysozyme (muramidase)